MADPGGNYPGNDPVTTFIEHWRLDEKAAEYLRCLDEGVRNTIIVEFAPRDNTHDIAGKMYAFARSVMSKSVVVAEMSPELELFVQRWQLDNAAVAWLTSLPSQVSNILVQQFEPKEDTHNVIGKMRSFARSIQARLPAGGGQLSPAEAQMLDALAVRLSEFAQRWNIDESALALVRAMPVDVQATVIEQFDPKGDVVNVNGKLCAFARSIAAGRQGQDILESFAAHWGLDESAKQFLRSLPEEVRTTVFHQFEPDKGTRDVSNKLRMFAKGVLSGTIAATAGVPTAPAAAGHTTLQAWRLAEVAAAAAGAVVPGELAAPLFRGVEPGVVGAVISADPSINEFVARWGLDAGTVPILESLPEDVRIRVLQEFDPRGNTRNPSGKLIAFVRTVVSGQGRSAPRLERHFPQAPQAPQAALLGGGCLHHHLGAGTSVVLHAAPCGQMVLRGQPGHAVASHSEADFLARWGLSGNQTALDVLGRLQPAVRARVMAEFAPGHDTNNVLGKLCGFATSVARAAVKEFAGGLPPLRTPPACVAPPQLHDVFRAAPLIQPLRGEGLAMAPDDFADRWNLDEGSRALLRGLEPDVQATVLAEFQPRDDVRDPSGKFCAFARSVAARLRSSPGKRPLGPLAAVAPPALRRRPSSA